MGVCHAESPSDTPCVHGEPLNFMCTTGACASTRIRARRLSPSASSLRPTRLDPTAISMAMPQPDLLLSAHSLLTPHCLPPSSCYPPKMASTWPITVSTRSLRRSRGGNAMPLASTVFSVDPGPSPSTEDVQKFYTSSKYKETSRRRLRGMRCSRVGGRDRRQCGMDGLRIR